VDFALRSETELEVDLREVIGVRAVRSKAEAESLSLYWYPRLVRP
jgi:hypothetical protein